MHYVLCSSENQLNLREIKKHYSHYVLWKSIQTYVKLKNIMKGTRRSSIIVRKYSGSHRKLRPTGAEYESNDDLLRNMAAHSGLP